MGLVGSIVAILAIVLAWSLLLNSEQRFGDTEMITLFGTMLGLFLSVLAASGAFLVERTDGTPG